MTSQPESFANRVKLLRERLSISQENLAKELGVSFATVNRWENEKTSPSRLAKNQFERFCQEQEQQGRL